LNLNRWARAAAEGNWGEPLGEILTSVSVLYGLYALSMSFKRRATKRRSDESKLSIIALAVFVTTFAAWSDRAIAQSQPAPAADEVTCRQPLGGTRSIEACDRLVSSKRFNGHALAVILNDRGLLYFRNGDAQRALVDYDSAIAADPGLGTAHYNRGLALARLDRLGQAIDSFGEAGKLVPDRAVIWHSRGMAQTMTGNFAAAMADFDRAIGLDPKMALAWGYRGIAHVRLGEVEKGIADLKEALRLDPKNPTIAGALEDAETALAKR